MKKISEYDERQLSLMYNNLLAFEKKQVELSSLIGTLEFLLNAMESIENEWEEKFLNQITILESMNAIAIIKDAGEDAPVISKDVADRLINCAVCALKVIVEEALT